MTSEDLVRKVFLGAIGELYRRAGLFDSFFCEGITDSSAKKYIQTAENIVGYLGCDTSVGYEPLSNVFVRFPTDKNKKGSNLSYQYKLQALPEDKSFVYASSKKESCSSADYRVIVEQFEKEWTMEKVSVAYVSDLLRAWEQFTCLVPADDTAGQTHDISLYMRSKMTAAVACCLQQTENVQNENKFLMVSGDVSGIQDFIYTIPSKGALKSLRGRSFYLEIFMENFIDELLDELQLTRANLLYAGGGHFYILAANTEECVNKINKVKVACNRWLLKRFNTKLYLAVGCLPCGENELKQPDAQASLFSKISDVLNHEKLHRYGKEELAALFDNNSGYNHHEHGDRECIVCHSSSGELTKCKELSSEGYVCPVCKALYNLGEDIIEKQLNCFVVLEDDDASALPLFGMDKDYVLRAVAENDCKNAVRIYCKNTPDNKELNYQGLFLVDYSIRDAQERVKTFGVLAKESVDEEKGIKRLGVLRADVDNLGAAFLAGFNGTGESNLTRYADLSHALAVFFKKAVDDICEGKMPDGVKRFSLFGTSKKGERKVHVVYSGGDDMFFVGAWEDLLELAVDIRECFRKFTGDKLTFSAGFGLFHDSFPISKMADYTGELESISKSNKDSDGTLLKDGLALFGFTTEIKNEKNENRKRVCEHIYQWKDFKDDVCGEKLKLLMDNLSFDDKKDEHDGKIQIGKGQLYNLMELLDQVTDRDIKLARLAYWLGRLQPKKKDEKMNAMYDAFTVKMFNWFKNSDDRKALRTAITLLVYYLRDTEKEEK